MATGDYLKTAASYLRKAAQARAAEIDALRSELETLHREIERQDNDHKAQTASLTRVIAERKTERDRQVRSQQSDLQRLQYNLNSASTTGGSDNVRGRLGEMQRSFERLQKSLDSEIALQQNEMLQMQRHANTTLQDLKKLADEKNNLINSIQHEPQDLNQRASELEQLAGAI